MTFDKRRSAILTIQKKKNETAVTQPVCQEELLVYLPLVRKVAYRFAKTLPACIDINDLISAGYLGLLNAAEKYDSSRGVNFETFVEFYIKWAILDELRAVDPVPRRSRQKMQKMERMRRLLTGQLGRPPRPEEMAAKMGLSLEEYESLIGKIAPGFDVSLSLLDQGYLSLVQADTDKKPLAENLLLQKELLKRLTRAIEILPSRMRTIISLYYYKKLNYREIAKVLDLTESRICQIRQEAIDMIRNNLQEHEIQNEVALGATA